MAYDDSESLRGDEETDDSFTSLEQSGVLHQLREEYWENVQEAPEAGASAHSVSVVGFEAGDRSYHLDLKSYRNIVRLPKLARVPHAPRWLLGVMAIRGEVTPVIDFSIWTGQDPSVPTVKRRVILVGSGPLSAGLAVDKVGQIEDLPYPLPEAAEGEWSSSVQDGQGGQQVFVLPLLEAVFVELHPEGVA